MESIQPLARHIYGEVGYGKTEIAMRGAFKVVCDDKQVGILVPTTILAEQHFKSFMQRFAAFPVKIGLLSRLQNTDERPRGSLHKSPPTPR